MLGNFILGIHQLPATTTYIVRTRRAMPEAEMFGVVATWRWGGDSTGSGCIVFLFARGMYSSYVLIGG